MILYIIAIIVLIYIALNHTQTHIVELFSNNKGLNEGRLSYNRRMIIKHIHRPISQKYETFKKFIREKTVRFKRNYL